MHATDLSIDTLLERSRAFDRELARSKAELEPPEFWGSHGGGVAILAAASEIARPEHRDFGRFFGGGGILELGALHGEFALFAESLGCRATVMTPPATESPAFYRARRLIAARGSQLALQETGPDGTPLLAHPYDFAFVVDELPFVKNPYGALERLARGVRFSLFTTPVAAHAAGGAFDATPYPLALLADGDELGTERACYWIPTEMTVMRLLARVGWSVLDRGRYGDRVVALLESSIFGG